MNPTIDPAPFMFALLAVIPLAAGVAFTRGGYRALRERRRLQDRPTSRVRSLALGPVEIAGVVEAAAANADPIYKKPFVVFDARVEHKVITHKEKSVTVEWRTIHDEDLPVAPFWLRDDTGRALVWAPGAEFRTLRTVEYKSGFFGSLFSGSCPELEYLRKVKGRRIFIRPVRVRAWFMRPGDPAWVEGTAVRPEQQARESFAEVWAEACAGDTPAIVSGETALVIAESEKAAIPSAAGVVARLFIGPAFVIAAFAFLAYLALAVKMPERVAPFWNPPDAGAATSL